MYSDFPELLVDAPSQMSEFLEGETDMSAKRNALLMLVMCAQERESDVAAGLYLDANIRVNQDGEL